LLRPRAESLEWPKEPRLLFPEIALDPAAPRSHRRSRGSPKFAARAGRQSDGRFLAWSPSLPADRQFPLTFRGSESHQLRNPTLTLRTDSSCSSDASPPHVPQRDEDRRRDINSRYPRKCAPSRYGVHFQHDQTTQVQIGDQVDTRHLSTD